MDKFPSVKVFEDIDNHETGYVTQKELRDYFTKNDLSPLEIDDGMAAFGDLPELISYGQFLDAWLNLPTSNKLTGLSNEGTVKLFHEISGGNRKYIAKRELENNLIKFEYNIGRRTAIMKLFHDTDVFITYSEFFDALINNYTYEKYISNVPTIQLLDASNGRRRIVMDEALHLFITVDKYNQGAISKRNIRRYMYINNYTEEEIDTLMEDLAVVTSHKVTYEEFCNLTNASPLDEGIVLVDKINPTKLFAAVDKYETGYINKKALAQHLYYCLYPENEIDQFLSVFKSIKGDEVSYPLYCRLLEVPEVKISQVGNLSESSYEEDFESEEEVVRVNSQPALPIQRMTRKSRENRLANGNSASSNEAERPSSSATSDILIELNFDPVELFYEIDKNNEGYVTKRELLEKLTQRDYHADDINNFMDIFAEMGIEEHLDFDEYCNVFDLDHQNFQFPTTVGPGFEILRSNLPNIHKEWVACNTIRRIYRELKQEYPRERPERDHCREWIKRIRNYLEQTEGGRAWHCLIISSQYWAHYSHEPECNVVVKYKGLVFIMFKTPM